MSDQTRIGVIGVGHIGRQHLRGYASLEDANVVAISDVNGDAARRASEEFGVTDLYEDYHALLERDDIDAVSVCTPPFNHAEITIAAARAGKHVLCEKPMAMTAAEAKAMVEAANEAGVKLGICHARSRFSAVADAAREYVLSGRLGEVYYGRTTAARRRGRPGIDILKDSRWFLSKELAGGGTLYDIGCYQLDLMLYVLGSPQPLTVSAITYRGIPHDLPPDVTFDVEEHASLFIRLEGGIGFTVETAFAINMEGQNFSMVLGNLGGLRFDPFTFYTEENGKPTEIRPELPEYDGGDLFSDFVRACRTEALPKTPGEDGLKVMQMMDAAYEAARTGHEVAIVP